MKVISFFLGLILLQLNVIAQENFQLQLQKARTANSKKDLEDTRYNLLLALQQLDLKIGQEIMKLMPLQLNRLNADPKNDQLNALSAGFIGASFHRAYGFPDSLSLSVEIVSNSPFISGLNTWLNNPMMAGISGKQSYKIDGYKAAYSMDVADVSDRNGKPVRKSTGVLQIPISNSLVTLKSENLSVEEFLKAAEQIPISKIAEMLK